MAALPRHTDDALIALLERERAAFLAVVDRMPLGLRGRRLLADAWSAAEVVEHVARTERGVARMLHTAASGGLGTPSATTPIDAPLRSEVVASVRDRSGRWEAPGLVQPTGVEPAAALEELAQARLALLEAYHTVTDATLGGASYPHPYLGPMTLRAWMELIAHHDARHAAQVGEMLAFVGRAPG